MPITVPVPAIAVVTIIFIKLRRFTCMWLSLSGGGTKWGAGVSV
ncbi:hypothetical protein QN360_16945 [Glaciimonas sp. CA11.2]|nr:MULTISPECIES: hypothetical protein [unclassified Glaciimonas]MDY7549014.1 hypothetical protein [Glaciimonas sp. CA11.2]MEB0013192.1 hypothetical protein [Glaciimonas sp. Cout2]MEB0081925.1 hypothetical protein [Glaciimonas sp. Gout2]MEB0164584.1 hypothetical protein [Glaciimonas sp. CA11.2]